MTPNYDNLRTFLDYLRNERNLARFTNIEGVDHEEFTFYLLLLRDAGLIEVTKISNKHGDFYTVERITLKGHNFLDRVTDDEIWDRAKESFPLSSAITSISDFLNIINFLTNATGTSF